MAPLRSTHAVGHERAKELYGTLFRPRPGDTVDDLRARFDAMLASFPMPRATTVEELEIAGMPAIKLTSEGVESRRALLWFHGGGFTIGSALGYSVLAAGLSAAAGMGVVVPEYRLAPEHPFPAAVEDAALAARWLTQTYGAAASFVGGDSAGGALAVTALTSLRDEGRALPAKAVALSPLVDLTGTAASYETNGARDVAISAAAVRMVRRMYLQGHDPNDPLASPLRAQLADLPPLLILASSSEVLLDDARSLVARVSEAGGVAELIVHADMVHAWPLFAPELAEGQLALEQIGGFLKR
jgi:acetyl esterase/lipase